MTLNEVKTYLSTGIVVYRGTVDRLSIQGPDTFDFLNRLSTQQFTKELINHSITGAFLTGKSEIIALFQAWIRSENEVEIFLNFETKVALTEYVNERKFSENIQFTPKSDLVWIEMRGQKIPYQNSNIVTTEEIGNKKIVIVPLDHWGVPGVLMGSTTPEDILSAVKSSQFKILDEEDLNLFEAFYGYQKVFDGSTQVLEAGLDRYVNRTKGCYPGQEVVEKIYTYGKPAKKLVQFVFVNPVSKSDFKVLLESTNKNLVAEGKSVGKWSEILMLDDLCFGLGVVERLHSDESKLLGISANGSIVKIQKLT